MPKKSRYRKKANLFLIFSILWALLLSLLAIRPEEEISFFLPLPFMSTAAHALAYCILAWLLCLYCRFQKKHLVKLFLLSVLLASSWGIVNELLQFLEPSRFPDWRDAVTNATGAFLSALVFVIWRKIKVS